MESVTFEIDSAEKVIYINKRVYYVITFSIKALYLAAGLWMFFFLKDECLFNPDSNSVVTVYIAFLSLACFQGLGVPIDKLVNVELLKP